ncbi:MAG: hypothetical protein K6G84_15605 [Lachnospiraceae bacterium]|nr:hypothetical protein [Lachnospiraceae bacterium]
MKNYHLMHKNDICGVLSIDIISSKFENYKDNNEGFSPFLGNTTIENMNRWWEMRAIPSSRETIRKLINSLEIITSEDYLAKNLALSITDTYWIKPDGSDLKYEDINLFNLKDPCCEKIPYHNASCYDPNASLGGQMEKYWDMSHDTPVLTKEAFKYFGQQAVNEVFATLIHTRQNTQIPFVKYSLSATDEGSILSFCDSFTNEDIEFISAYEIVSSSKVSNNNSMYEHYIKCCKDNGIDEEYIRTFMDYQTLTDFVISNSDEHLMNFGILRDANTMKLLGPAPIFDSGNSMFFSNLKKTPFTRAELLERQITSFYKTEEKMLKNVRYKNIVDVSLLPQVSEVKDFYANNGIPEDRAERIAINYGTKCTMLNEFQHGKTISFYNEKTNDLSF